MKKTGKFAVLSLIFLGVVASVSAFAGGDGSASNPYQISTCNQLDNMTEPSANYTLINDIDCSSYTGYQGNKLKGFLKGQGYEIKNLSYSAGDKGGLINISRGANITNLGVINGNITGSLAVGGIVGVAKGDSYINNVYFEGKIKADQNFGGIVGKIFGSVTINNSYSKGKIRDKSGGTDTTAGGLVGYIDNAGALVTNSYSSMNVKKAGSDKVGGLVGYLNTGTVKNSYATGNVTGDNQVGGLTGLIFSGTVTNSYATGYVEGNKSLGGLVGWNVNGYVYNSYAKGDVNGGTIVGGLVGNLGEDVVNSYSTGNVTGSDRVGGFAGNVDTGSGGNVTDSYWDVNTSGTTNTNGSALGLTTKEMTGSNAENNMAFDFNSIWTTINSNYPQLIGNREFGIEGIGNISALTNIQNYTVSNLDTSAVHTPSTTFFDDVKVFEINNSNSSSIDADLSSLNSNLGIKTIPSGKSNYSVVTGSSTGDLISSENNVTDLNYAGSGNLSSQEFNKIRSYEFSNDASKSLTVNISSVCSSAGTVTASTGLNSFQCDNTSVSKDKLAIQSQSESQSLNSSKTHTVDNVYFKNTTEFKIGNSFSSQLNNINASSGTNGFLGVIDVPSGSTNFTGTEEVTKDLIQNEQKSYSVSANSSFSHDLASQGTVNESTLTFDNKYSSNLNVDLTNCPSKGVVTALTGSNSISGCGFSSNTGDFLVNESFVDSGYGKSPQSSDLNTQYYRKFSDLKVENKKSFTFNNVDLSSLTNNVTTADISSGINTVKDAKYTSKSGDFLNDTSVVKAGETDGTGASNLTSQSLFTTYDFIGNNTAPKKLFDVNISSVAEGTQTADISTGQFRLNNIKNQSQRGDFISKSTSLADVRNIQKQKNFSKQHFQKVLDVGLSNSKSFALNGINTPSLNNAGTVDVPAGGTTLQNGSLVNQSGDFISVSEKLSGLSPVLSGNNLSQQSYKKVFDAEVSNSQGFTITNVNTTGLSNIGVKDIPSGNTTFQNSTINKVSGDFIVNESEQFTVSVLETGNNLTAQRFGNSSDFSFDNNRSVAIKNLNISSRCSATTVVNISAGGSKSVSCQVQSTNIKDKLNAKNISDMRFTSTPATFGFGIGNNQTAVKKFKVENTYSSSIQANLKPNITLPKKVSLKESNYTENFVSGISTESVSFEAKVGEENSNILNTSTSGDTTTYKYQADFHLYQDPPLGDRQYCFPLSRLNSYSNRDSGSLSVKVDGTSSGFTSVVKSIGGDQYFCVNLPESVIGASPHTATVTYTTTSSGSGGGGGGSGGGSITGDATQESGLIGTGVKQDLGTLTLENSTYQWRMSAVGTANQGSFSLFGNSGETSTIPFQLVNLGERTVKLNLSVQADSDRIEDNVRLSRKNVTIEPSGVATEIVKVTYSIPENYTGDNFNFRIRATDQSWNGESKSVGVEYLNFDIAMSEIVSVLLDRYSRVASFIEWNPSFSPSPIPIPFILIPLIPSVMVFGLSRTIRSGNGRILVVQAGGSILLFLVLIGLIPPI